MIQGIRFNNEKRKKIDEYKPARMGYYARIHNIGENEEIIGVYGHNQSETYFNSFGFIVKVKDSIV